LFHPDKQQPQQHHKDHGGPPPPHSAVNDSTSRKSPTNTTLCFQAVSATYESLMNPPIRAFYDTTGNLCATEEDYDHGCHHSCYLSLSKVERQATYHRMGTTLSSHIEHIILVVSCATF